MVNNLARRFVVQADARFGDLMLVGQVLKMGSDAEDRLKSKWKPNESYRWGDRAAAAV